MMYYTHLVFSILCGLLFLDAFYISHAWIFLLIVAICSFIPDIDNYKSKVGRKLPIISHIINFIFGHRKIFHSLLVPIVILILGYLFNFVFVGWAFFVGFVSHLIGDSFTKEGINFLYPFNLRISGFFKTGSFIESLLFVIIFVIDVVLVLRLI